MLQHQPSIIATISYFTHGWMQNLITNLWRHLPDTPILVVDNNPDPNEPDHLKNYIQRKFHHNPTIEAERYWLNHQHDKGRLHLTKQPNRHDLTHGNGIDCAKQWCLQNHYQIMTHIEPDCFFDNNQWYHEQITAIHQGNYVAGWHTAWISHLPPDATPEQIHQAQQQAPIHPCCTTYYLPFATNLTFTLINNKTDRQQPEFAQIITPYFQNNYWDTGEKIWYEAAKQNRTKRTNPHGMSHQYHGTLHDYWTKEPYPLDT